MRGYTVILSLSAISVLKGLRFMLHYPYIDETNMR